MVPDALYMTRPTPRTSSASAGRDGSISSRDIWFRRWLLLLSAALRASFFLVFAFAFAFALLLVSAAAAAKARMAAIFDRAYAGIVSCFADLRVFWLWLLWLFGCIDGMCLLLLLLLLLLLFLFRVCGSVIGTM